MSAEEPIDDLALIQQIRFGHWEAYADIVRQYQSRVVRLCVSMLSDEALAEDAAQEVFLKVYKALDTFRGDASFSTWIYRVTANHCKDLLRKRAREKTDSWEALLEEHGEQIQRMMAVPQAAEPSTANAELIEIVLSQLSPDYRLILTLREVQGLSYQEISDTLGDSIQAVKSRLRRARQELQKKLRHFSGTQGV